MRRPGCVAYSYDAKCQPDRLKVEVEKAVAFNPYDADNWGARQILSIFRSVGRREGVCRKSHQVDGPRGPALLVVGAGEAPLVPGRISRSLRSFSSIPCTEGLWLSHLDLAYTLPFLGRIDDAKAQVSALLKVYPSMTIREADAFYKLICFEPAFREKMGGALRQAGLPE
jgi:hypothetical protein